MSSASSDSSPRPRPPSPRPFVVGLLVAVMLLSAVTPFVATARETNQVIGRPSVTVYSPNTEFSRGQTTTLNLYLNNDGSVRRGGPAEYVSRVQTARATRLTVDSGNSPIEVDTGTYPVGDVPPDSVGPIPIQLTIPDDAKAGTYDLPVKLTYRYTHIVTYTTDASGTENVQYADTTVQKTANIEVTVKDEADFRIVDVASTAQVGQRGTVDVTLQNVGSDVARDATVTLESLSGDVTFGPSQTTSRHVGRWQPGERKTVSYRTTVSDEAATEQYALEASVTYDDDKGISQQSDPLSTGIVPLPEQTFGLETGDSTLQVDREGTVTGTITNGGPVAARDAVLVLEPPSRNVHLDDTEYALGSLAPGESRDFSFSVEVSDQADAGMRQFTYHVRYQNRDNETRQSNPLNSQIEVQQRSPRFSVKPKSATLSPGGTSTVTVEVTNNAEESIRNVDVKAFADDPLSVSSDRAFAESLGPGESTDLTFQLSAAGSAIPKTYSFELDIKYDDATGETKLSDTYSVPVTVQETDSGGGPPIPFVIVGLLVVVAVAVGLWYRRRE